MSPCIKQCKLSEGVCQGCLRTLEEIIAWRDMSMSERMVVMQEIQSRTSTHTCPSCEGPAYCVMEDGKSSSTCWCMSIPVKESKPNTLLGEQCLCKSCLTKEG